MDLYFIKRNISEMNMHEFIEIHFEYDIHNTEMLRSRNSKSSNTPESSKHKATSFNTLLKLINDLLNKHDKFHVQNSFSKFLDITR